MRLEDTDEGSWPMSWQGDWATVRLVRGKLMILRVARSEEGLRGSKLSGTYAKEEGVSIAQFDGANALRLHRIIYGSSPCPTPEDDLDSEQS